MTHVKNINNVLYYHITQFTSGYDRRCTCKVVLSYLYIVAVIFTRVVRVLHFLENMCRQTNKSQTWNIERQKSVKHFPAQEYLLPNYNCWYTLYAINECIDVKVRVRQVATEK